MTFDPWTWLTIMPLVVAALGWGLAYWVTHRP